MKRILALLLCLSLLFSVSCASSLPNQTIGKTEETKTLPAVESTTEEERETGPITLPEGFSAGWAREVVNPDQGTSLGGWPTAEKRLSGAIVDDIKLTLTALSDGEKVFFLFSTDALAVSENLFGQFAALAEKAKAAL